ncbi:hypothetical protein H072_5442 [Dactylellina haptotyla CBS 200.50]|uniref:Uncharacterized protein n=1 Tax=Dactylellina haptotyla (strain CBS 200.50) TaxID=1284197 RepID=S8BZ55_DACHA|nr:hypothetical protein H072_5442 [Dactylellina haptotyla CBS 200.50]
MPTTYHPPLFFTASHTFTTLSLTSLSAFMISSPQLYHKHIIRSTNPSTTDLFVSTQFTNSTQSILYSTIRSSGMMLLGTSIGLFATRHSHPSSFTVMTTVTLGVAAGHAYMLKDILSNAILRRSWLQETERVTKMGVIVGVNVLTAMISLWAGLSYGGWPWRAERSFFTGATQTVHTASSSYSGADELDIEGVVNVFVKGAVELAGGVTGILQGFLQNS